MNLKVLFTFFAIVVKFHQFYGRRKNDEIDKEKKNNKIPNLNPKTNL